MKRSIRATAYPYEPGLSGVRTFGRKMGLVAEDINEIIDVLDDLQDKGISTPINTFTDDELEIIGRAAEILERRGHLAAF